jgi:hypothetical protein
VQYLGIDWGTRKAAWCAIDERGATLEGAISADEGGLAKLVHGLGPDVRGCVEMMSGAVWVRDQLQAAGWIVQVADAQGQGAGAVGGEDGSGRRAAVGGTRAP